MSNGLLAKAALVAGVPSEVYQITASVQFATASIYVLNTNASIATVDVWFSTSASPSAGDKVVSQTQVPAAGGELVLDCRLLSPGERIFVQSNVSSCFVRIEGLEKA